MSYNNIGIAYSRAIGVERDEAKANNYYKLAAIGGHMGSRHNLGNAEAYAYNMDRALKHWMIAIVGGEKESLSSIQVMFKHGRLTKDNYAKALVARQAYLDEVKSPQRDEAAAFDERYKYY